MRNGLVALTVAIAALTVPAGAIAKRPALSLERAADAAQVRGDLYADSYNDPAFSEPDDFKITNVAVGDCERLAAWRVECEIDYVFGDGDDCADTLMLWTVRTGRVHASGVDPEEWECASDDYE